MTVSQPLSAPRAVAPAYGFAIDPSEVARFRRLLPGATDGSSTGAPLPGTSVPAFFLCRALPPAVRSALAGTGADAAAVRHAGQRITLRRRPGPDERLTAHAVVESVGDYGFQRAVVLRVTLRDAAGDAVAELLTTLAIGPATGQGRIDPQPAAVLRGPPLLHWRTRVPDDLPERYARASGDDNPIHTDAEAARRAGLPGVVLHGMATLQLAAAGLTERLFGGDETRWREVRTRFARPVRPGDTIAFTVHREEAYRADVHREDAYREEGAGPGGDVLGLSASVDGKPVLKDTWFSGAVA
ncbi:MaoC/PaaZ C-terminal domain-containing protein [Streptomyces sp. bgisy100]|uniref:MaoC/PaaZ C-terminal domain-containing protein n=1 Tax=Streptomyces sp. bgisy100 TaxID=3413783 RepID=UPI003D714A54